MKKLLLLGVAFTALAVGPALAADLGQRPVYKGPPPPPPPPVISWTGWYVGLNAGWVGSANNSDVTLSGTDTGTGGIGRPLGVPPGQPSFGVGNQNGFIGGGQVGYNWQFGQGLVGLEADFDGTTGKSSTSFTTHTPGFVPVTYGLDTKLQTLGTFRGRLGFLPMPTFLLYVTGGLAYGEHEVSLSALCPTCGPPANLASSATQWNAGWTVGAGVEWLFAPKWSVKAEYLYVDLGNNDSTTIFYKYGANSSSLTATSRDKENIARVGINYHF